MLKAETDDLSTKLSQALAQKKVMQEEKDMLLQDLATR